MKIRRLTLIIVVGVLFSLVAAGSVLTRSSGTNEVAVDTTGATAGQGGTVPDGIQPSGKSNAQATPGSKSPAAPGTKSDEPTPPPATIDVNSQSINIERGPVVLLNPSTARQGSSIGVTGSGFDPGSTVDLVVKKQKDDNGDTVTFVQVDKSGSFGGVNLTISDTLSIGPFYVEARERKAEGQGYSKTAQVTGTVAGGSAQVKLGTQVGQPGTVVELSAKGFSPNESISVYWNSLDSEPVGAIRSDGNGSVARAQIRVPYGAVGNNSFIFIGEKSQSPVTANFLMLSLYPTAGLSSYAIKADNVLSFNLKDFGPDEQVAVYLNNPNGTPITTVQTDADGTFSGSGGFLVPFALRGQQTLIFIGEQSTAPATASFDILPYTPNVQPSTYGGRPGTTVAFYGSGFAKNEVVHVYTGRSDNSAGREVACFATDAKGNAGAGGQYVIPGDAPAGQLQFTMLASKSQATTIAAIEVMVSDVPVQVPTQGDFTCTLDDNNPSGAADEQALATPTQQPQPDQSTAPAPATPTPSAPAQQQTAPAQTPTQTQQPTQQPTQAPATNTSTPAPAEPNTPTPNANNVHTVQAGDTLSRIAQQYGTTVDAIVQANGIKDPNRISTGQELKIPAPFDGSAPANNNVAPATTTPAQPPTQPPAQPPTQAPTQPPAPPPAPANNAHTVQPGDTLSQIAQQYGTSVDAIVQANGMQNPDQIQAGQRLTIPPAPK